MYDVYDVLVFFFKYPMICVLFQCLHSRGTQCQFSENTCSEGDLRSRIFATFFGKICCLAASPRIFAHLKNGIIAHF